MDIFAGSLLLGEAERYSKGQTNTSTTLSLCVRKKKKKEKKKSVQLKSFYLENWVMVIVSERQVLLSPVVETRLII